MRNISLDLVEKDYVLGLVLHAISSSQLSLKVSLKGGTALSKVYFPGRWRFSEDLDFTLTEGTEVKAIGESQISELPFILQEISGVQSRVLGNVYSNPNYLKFRLQYEGPISKNTVKIEFSSENFVGPVIRKDVPKEYDYSNFSILSYSIENILSEKIRAILQRGKLRDYYDVWKLLKTVHFRSDHIMELFTRKCQSKGVNYGGIDQFFPEHLSDNLKRYLEAGLTRLTTEELPDLEVMLDDLRDNLIKILH